MSEGSLSLDQWIKHILFEIRNVVSLSSQLAVNRAQLSSISNQLRQFSNSLRMRPGSGKIIDQSQLQDYEQIIPILNNAKDLFYQQMEGSWIDFLNEHPLSYLNEQLGIFVNDFNEKMQELGFNDIQHLSWNDFQSNSDFYSDLGIIQQLLENFDVVDNEKIEEIKNTREKIAQDNGINQDGNKSKALDYQTIQKSLSSFGNYDIDYEDLILERKIGSGGFAEVYLGYLKEDKKAVAVKKLHQQQFDAQMLESFKSEVATLARLEHFAILPFVGACTKSPYCIVTEFMSGGSLFSRLHTKEEEEKLSPTQLTIIALGISYGMNYLHEQNMLHRDLKSLNILLDGDAKPKISDFGMAITQSGGNMVDNGIGTPQWMAPEVLTHQRCDEKSDVYSFGIILWEMLTKEIPYKGYRDIHVTLSVINQNNRPKIPPNCQQSLANLIRMCWSSDPDRRPSFSTIVNIFESNTIVFPGTDISQLNEYVSEVSGKSDVEFVNIYSQSEDGISREQLENLLNHLQDQDSTAFKLNAAVLNSDVSSKLSEFDIITPLIDFLNNNTRSNLMVPILSVLNTLFENEAFLAAFIERSGGQALLDILTRSFSLPDISQILDCLIQVIKIENIEFQQNHMTKLSLFLLELNDINVRMYAIILINDIIVNQCYEDESVFSVIIEYLLRCATNETAPNLLLSALNLLLTVSTFEGAKAKIRAIEGPDRICSLMIQSDQEILSATFQLLHMLFDGAPPRQRTNAVFLSYLPSVLESGDYNTQLDALNTLTVLMDNTLIYKDVAADHNIARSFVHVIESDDITVQVSSLRICFCFCSNEITARLFRELVPDLLNLLLTSTDPAILACYSLCALLAQKYVDPIDVLEDSEEKMHEFLDSAFALESELTAPAIRLAGVLCGTISGASLLKKWNIMSKVSTLLESENEELNQLAFKAITALSSVDPAAGVLHDIIPLLFTRCDDLTYDYYPLICISNITCVPDNAVECIPFIPNLFSFINGTDDIAIQRAVVALHRIVMIPESNETLCQQDFLDRFYEASIDLFATEHAPILYEIFEKLSILPQSRKVLKEKGLDEIIEQYMTSLSLNNPCRPKLIRIHSRLAIS